MKIGIMGVSLQSTNKGCEALAYSFLEILNCIAKKHGVLYEVLYIQKMPTRKFINNRFSFEKTIDCIKTLREYSNLSIDYCLLFHTKNHIIYSPSISKCEIIFDFTEGDSFSDIYGEARFWSDTNLKLKIMKHGIPYVLGSQTIGPFYNTRVKKQAKEVILKSKEVYARDKLSYQCARDISGRDPVLTTDIAFRLPYEKLEVNNKSNKKRVGFNPSGLLWSGGVDNENQFNLKVNYKDYCRAILLYFTKRDDCEVYLVPHATSLKPDGTAEIDSDINACKELKTEFKSCIEFNVFSSCLEAKSYIATMDFFIGARMHATIAAMSTGVPVVPFSYSRKFEGLFGELKYPYLISGKTMTTDEAIKVTINYFERIDQVKERTIESRDEALDSISVFENMIDKYVNCESNK